MREHATTPKPTVGFLYYVVTMHHPGQVVVYKNFKKFKRLDLFQSTAACSNGTALETIIMEKVNRHDLAF